MSGGIQAMVGPKIASFPSGSGRERSCHTLNVPSTTVRRSRKNEMSSVTRRASTSNVGATVLATSEYARIRGTYRES